MAALMGRQLGSGILGLGTHIWLRVAEWRDRADLSVFFFRFHSGGVDWNFEGSVKGDRREPRQRDCPLTGSSQFRFRSRGSERRHWTRGMIFMRFIAPPDRVRQACAAFCVWSELLSSLARRLASSMELRLCSMLVPVRLGFD